MYQALHPLLYNTILKILPAGSFYILDQNFKIRLYTTAFIICGSETPKISPSIVSGTGLNLAFMGLNV